jgi:hypothetical protein
VEKKSELRLTGPAHRGAFEDLIVSPEIVRGNARQVFTSATEIAFGVAQDDTS